MKKWRVEQTAWLALMVSFAVVAGAAWSMRHTIGERLRAQSLDSLLESAHTLESEGNPEQAAPIYESLASRYPDNEQVLVECGRFWEAQGRPDVAERAYQQAASLGLQQFGAVRRYAGFLDRAGRGEAALALCESYVGQFPGDLGAQRDLGLRYLQLQKWDAAVEPLQLAASRADLEFEARAALATAYAKSGNSREAIEEWERVVAMGSEREKQLYLQDIAQALASDGRLQDSLQTWRSYAEHFPNSILGVRRILELCEELETEDVCSRAALRALATFPPRTVDWPATNRIRVAGVSELSGTLAPGGRVTGDVYLDIVSTVPSGKAPSAAFMIGPADREEFTSAAVLTSEPSGWSVSSLWRGDTVRQAFSLALPDDLRAGQYHIGLALTPDGLKPISLWTISITADGAPVLSGDGHS